MNDRFLRLPGQKWLGRRILSSIELVELNRYTCDIYLGDAGANVFSTGEGYVNSSHRSTHGRVQSPVSFPVLSSGDGMTTKTNSEHCFTQDALTPTGGRAGMVGARGRTANADQSKCLVVSHNWEPTHE